MKSIRRPHCNCLPNQALTTNFICELIHMSHPLSQCLFYNVNMFWSVA
uniref:Uncharacterized protein n=1 Tax=Rhizophora mucronata TaxID=61149 RepID=A0A2P2P457_RHIMU